ncbi:MAG TPA: sulfatase [Gaiellaceae bacterium]|nr:sulfatase [Gaiellaceae bacterium]
MRRVAWIWLGAALLLVFGALFGAVRASAGKPSARYNHRVDQRLNVVVILSDDERWDGTTVMQNVKRLLVDHGVNFTNAHVTTPICGPSRASILTGQYAHHTGVLDNFGTHAYPAFKEDEADDLPVWMHDAGYRTSLVGKYINAYTGAAGHHAIPPGWDNWQVLDSIPMEAYYNYSINNNGRLEHYGSKPADYSTTVLTHKAVNFIHRAHRPFFLYFAPVTPHLPAIPDKRDQGKLQNIAPINSPAFNQRNIGKEPWRFWHKDMLNAAGQLYINHVRIKQEEALLSLDRSVGKVVQALKDRHELKRTVIVYTSDNGFLWGEHRLGGKVWPYQESTHVPLVVRTPWTTSAQKNNQPVLNIDLAPTITELAGITPTLPQDGRSFVPFLHGQQAPWRHAFLEEYLGKDMLRSGGPPPYVAVQTRRNLWVEYRNGWRELYSLKKDPWELNNIAGSPRTKPLQTTLSSDLTRLFETPATPVVNQHK